MFAGYDCISLFGLLGPFGCGENNKRYITSVERYSFETKTWDKVSEMRDEREHHCICSFMDKVFITGGCYSDFTPAVSCLEFSTKSHVWRKVARTNGDRSYGAAATVYQGKVVVCGGRNRQTGNGLRTAECFDVGSSGWSPMQSMIGSKWGHSVVVANDKTFVFGTRDCEVFDAGRLVSLKSPQLRLYTIIYSFSNFTSLIKFIYCTLN